MNLLKVGDYYLNLPCITHIELENESRGLLCTVHFNCQVTDRDGSNGIQACKIFTGSAAKELRVTLDKFATGASA
jgi:hypothetical protein